MRPGRAAVAASDGQRVLGFGMCLALVVGSLIGSGIYLLPANLAPYGWNAPIGWAISTAGALALAHMFARLAAHRPAAGGPYAYCSEAFGDGVGFAVAWAHWGMIWLGNGAIAVAVVGALSLFVPAIATVPGLPALLAVVLVWITTAINIRGVDWVGRVQLVTTILKQAPLIAVVLIALVVLGAGDAAPFATTVAPLPVTLDSAAAAAALTFWGFVGLEAATVPAERIEAPERTIPRATLIGTALAGLVYMLVATAIMLLMPYHQAAMSSAPVADFIGGFWGSGAARAVALFAAISAFGTLNGFVLVQGEIPWAMASGGVFPRWLAATGRHGTPVRAHIVSSVLLTTVTLMNYARSLAGLFEFIALVSIVAGLVAYIVCALAALKLLRGERLIWLTAPAAMAFCLWALYGCGLVTLFWGAVLIAIGLPVYLWVRLVEHRGVVAKTAA